MKRKDIQGFTMIELIVVIAIIGILAAIAVPRFITQTSNARVAALNGVAGAINSAVELAQAEYVAEGNSSTSTATSITMNGQAVTVIAGTGRPAGTAAGIGAALQTLSGFTPGYAAGVATYDFTVAVTNCKLTYTDTSGAVAVTSSGC
ncbi:MAG: prepilin-type N-terminal cleavage/methylation domain-containing protein [Gammaproteobacteria bacterium]|nr:prepilin-type N-terminal cleavage/methylation domain-containing protein [Gammaproteobacteria bacterium]